MPVKDQRCPECGWLGAYIGLNNVECPNIQCRHFSEKARKELDDKWKEYQDSVDRALEDYNKDPESKIDTKPGVDTDPNMPPCLNIWLTI